MALVGLLALGVSGCAAPGDASLKQGYEALRGGQYGRALSLADGEIRRSPTGPRAAEAHYLRGRALEQAPTRSASESAANLGAARAAYAQTLALRPGTQLRAFARASLGNVAYFQDDYVTAEEMFRLAYGELDDRSSRAWSLYRRGLSLQRLGRFTAADEVFAEVRQKFPGTLQAQRAGEVAGAKAFYIRLGAFRDERGAEAESTQLRRQGFRGIGTFRDPRGLWLVRLGPYATYVQARDARSQLLGRYADAMVMP